VCVIGSISSVAKPDELAMSKRLIARGMCLDLQIVKGNHNKQLED
jgi:hypothetical protein